MTGESAESCTNCSADDLAIDRYHVHLWTEQVLALDLCEACRHDFVTADWVEFVV